jgi:hypothetical protein
VFKVIGDIGPILTATDRYQAIKPAIMTAMFIEKPL